MSTLPVESVLSVVPAVQSGTRPAPSTWRRPAGGLAALVGLLVLAQHARAESWPAGLSALLGVACVSALACLWRARQRLLPGLSSAPFAVTLLAVIALATALGTFVPQNGPAAPHGHAGRFGILWIEMFFLGDLFGSLWFGGLLGLLALSLAVVMLRRPSWRMTQWGLLLSHGGMIVVLAGALVGKLFGAHGQMHLHVGQATNQFSVSQGGVPTGEKRTLDFSLRLEAFDVEKYPCAEACRLFVYREQEDRKDGEECPTVVSSMGLKEARKGCMIASAGVRFRVLEYYPDIEVYETMEDTDDSSSPAAVQVRLKEGSRESTQWLSDGPSRTVLHAGGLDVEWGESGDGAWMERTVRGRPARHFVGRPGRAETVEVRVGETYNLPGQEHPFKVQEFLPNFCYDIEERRGYSASDEPRNPALGLEVLDADGKPSRKQWLFAGETGHMEKKGDLGLIYRFDPPADLVPDLIRVDGRARQFVYATGGREVLRRSFEPGQPVQVELAPGPAAGAVRRTVVLEITQALAHARPRYAARTLSQEPRNPGVLVEFQRAEEPSAREEAILVAKDKDGAWQELGGGLVLVLEPREEEVKAYRSQVAVVRDGEVLENATIAVNAPLSRGGYTFYQSDYRPDDPGFSGLSVVKDPGLGLVYAGLILVSLGVAFNFYVRPRLREGARGEARA